jgi:hypothetical protein
MILTKTQQVHSLFNYQNRAAYTKNLEDCNTLKQFSVCPSYSRQFLF